MQSVEKLPVSVLIGCHNEAHLLEKCISSVAWCNEIIVVDLDSTDHPEHIALKYGKYVKHERVKQIEDIFPVYIPVLKHDWVMLIDPDEVLDPELQLELAQFLSSVPEDVGRINVPIQYYFRNRPLIGTYWGGKRIGRLLINRSRVHIRDTVHTAITLKQGYRTHKIRHLGNNVDHHYWMTDWKQLIEKHRRYLKGEGLNMHQAGHRYTLWSQWKASIHGFWVSFVIMRGYLDGITGFSLSLFWAWYIYGKWESLKLYEKLNSVKR